MLYSSLTIVQMFSYSYFIALMFILPISRKNRENKTDQLKAKRKVTRW